MYKNKYLKYKNKYIELKNIMTGGNVNKLTKLWKLPSEINKKMNGPFMLIKKIADLVD